MCEGTLSPLLLKNLICTLSHFMAVCPSIPDLIPYVKEALTLDRELRVESAILAPSRMPQLRQ
jgi:hypothetical protein